MFTQMLVHWTMQGLVQYNVCDTLVEVDLNLVSNSGLCVLNYQSYRRIHCRNNPRSNHGIRKILPWFEVINPKGEA